MCEDPNVLFAQFVEFPMSLSQYLIFHFPYTEYCIIQNHEVTIIPIGICAEQSGRPDIDVQRASETEGSKGGGEAQMPKKPVKLNKVRQAIQTGIISKATK